MLLSFFDLYSIILLSKKNDDEGGTSELYIKKVILQE